jgi:hypothetical protein
MITNKAKKIRHKKSGSSIYNVQLLASIKKEKEERVISNCKDSYDFCHRLSTALFHT